MADKALLIPGTQATSLADGQGRVVDFWNTLNIPTSNLGSPYLAKMDDVQKVADVGPPDMVVVHGLIRPELRARPARPPGLEHSAEVVESLEADGFPLVDHYDPDSLSFAPGRGLEHNRRRLAALRPGVTYLIVHCARGDAELAAIAPESWRQRSEEHRICTDGSLAALLEEQGIATLGMRPLRDLLRGRCASAGGT